MAPAEKTAAIIQALEALANGDQAAAINAVQSHIQTWGETAEGLHILGLVALQLGDLSRALELMKGAHELDPGCREYADGLGMAYARSGRLSDSLYYGKLATALKPHPDIPGLLPEWAGTFEDSFMNVRESTYFSDGLQAFHAGRLNKALECFEKEAELHPSEGRSWRMLSKLMRIHGRPVEAQLLLQALQACEDFRREDHFLEGRALAAMGNFDKAIDSHLKGAGGEMRHVEGLICRIAALIEKNRSSNREIQTAEERLAGLMAAEIKRFEPGKPVAGSGRKVKVGWVSGRFRADAGLDLIWPVLLRGRSRRMAFYCYSHNEFDDAMTRRIAGSVEDFTDLGRVNDPTAATIIHNDGIDILIDLDGYGETGRPRVFAHHPAPVMLRYLALPSVMEAHGFAASLGGASVFKDRAGRFLPVRDGFYGLPDDMSPLDPETAARPGRRMLGWKPAMNRVDAHSANMVAGLLAQDPSMRLCLFVQGCGGVSALDHLDPVFDRAGILDRIDYAEPDDDYRRSLTHFLDRIDLLVDIEGDCGMDAALQSLCRMVPVLSLAGSRPHQRVVADLLTGLSLQEVVFEEQAPAQDAAAHLLRDRKERDALKQRIYDQLMKEKQPEQAKARMTRLEESLLSLLDVEA